MTTPAARVLKYSERTELIRIGQRMSNLMYNASQWQTTPEYLRIAMKDLCEEWDKVRKNGRLNPLRNRGRK